MDLERIKQQLRLRSGRSKKPPKQTKLQKPAASNPKVHIEQTRPSTSAGHSDGQASRSTTSKPEINGRSTQSPPLEERENGTRPLQRRHSELETDAELNTVSPGVADNPEPDVKDQAGPGEANNSNGLGSRRMPTSHDSPPQMLSRTASDPRDTDASVSSETEDFDLRPPAPIPKAPSMESMSGLLFSAGHLDTLLYNPSLLKRFTAFLQRYRSQDYPLLMRYLETSKALRAVEYANAVAENAPALPQPTKGNETETSNIAATFDTSFKESCSSAYETLLNTSLPLYITYMLIRIISECLTDEITGRITPVMRNMVGGLSEVFCLTDPNQEDNPIIYASEEFYRLTGYGQDSVIGHNCRFLQGPKTNRYSPKRIRESLGHGEAICETLLNYRRDGKPFINLLMVAPLHDGKGNIKYHIGAQVDVSGLIESGRTLDGFQSYLGKREADQKRQARENLRTDDPEDIKKRKVLEKLRQLSELFDLEESAVIQSHNRSASEESDDDVKNIGNGNARRRFVDSEASDDDNDNNDHDSTSGQGDWKLGQGGPLGLSGKLPGIYEKYMLIRPAPSLRIVFVSPKLQKFGSIVQSPFLSHIAAPNNTLSGLLESFKVGAPVSARINFMPQRSENRNGTKIPSNMRHEDGEYGRACWMSATPLLGGDSRIGVWMVVFVEKAQAKAQTKARRPQIASAQNQKSEIPNQTISTNKSAEQQTTRSGGTLQKPERDNTTRDHNSNGTPIKPRRLDEAIHSPVQRQDSQRSATAYQYQAATPVEEYHSADEDGKFTSAVTAVYRARTPPQMVKYGIIKDEEFVRPASIEPNSPSQSRVRISPDSDDGAEYEPTALQTSRDDLTLDTYKEGEIQDPNHIAPSTPSDQEPTLDEDESTFDTSTLVRSMTPDRDHDLGEESTETIRQEETASSLPSTENSTPKKQDYDHQDTPTSSKSQNSKNNTTLPAGLGYMDYFRHPSRQAPGDAQRREKSRFDNEGEACLSPYSVD